MLFSEPKIPQFGGRGNVCRSRCWFQCSSASRKFLNSVSRSTTGTQVESFSALQRAENSSIMSWDGSLVGDLSFSALQRAENSSIDVGRGGHRNCACVSVLFSEPKIPQSAVAYYVWVRRRSFQCSSASRKFLNSSYRVLCAVTVTVSVLFSEPKIPQLTARWQRVASLEGFSALQRAENSSMRRVRRVGADRGRFQCSSASRKFLNMAWPRSRAISRPSFSALQRAENSSIETGSNRLARNRQRFSALQRAENSSIFFNNFVGAYAAEFQCSSASRKFLNASIHLSM